MRWTLSRTCDTRRSSVTAFTNLDARPPRLPSHLRGLLRGEGAACSRKDYPARRVICIDDKWGKRAAAPLHRRPATAWSTTGFDALGAHPSRGGAVLSPRTPPVALNVRGDATIAFDYPLVGKLQRREHHVRAFGIGIQLGIGVSDHRRRRFARPRRSRPSPRARAHAA